MSKSALLQLDLARTFLLIFLSFSVLLLGISAVHYYTQYQAERVTLEASETVNVTLARRAVLTDIASVVTDLTVLARQLEGWLAAEGSVPDPGHLNRTFSIFIGQKRLYDQIRFLELSGREAVRVNFHDGRSQAVPPEGLQDKSGRYYFQAAMALRRGEIYISPLDLNVEQGVIERPFKPVMRFATPVFDRSGRRHGILVLNYLGRRLLDNFQGSAAHVVDHIHLVDDHGFWLSSPHPQDAWGFMLGHKRTFARRYPRDWPKIHGESEGQFISPQGLFTFSTVSPIPVAEAAGHSGFDVIGDPVHPEGSEGYAWKVISHVQPEQMGGTPGRFLARHSALYLSLLGLLALGSWLLARSRVHHRQAEAQGEYERRFRRTLEEIELAAVTVDRRGRLTFCNNYFLQLTGWQAREATGQEWVERFVPEEKREEIRRTLAHLEEPQRFPRRYEAEIQTRRGERRLLAWHNSLSLDTLGKAVSVTSIGEDITEKRRVEQELLKLHRAVEQSPSVVLITDRSGCIEYVNPKFSEVSGYRPEEVVGQNPRLLKSGETGPDEYAELWQTIAAGGVWHGEFHNRRKSGELYWEAAAISAVRDTHGEITHYLAVKEDITERKRLEQEVESRNRELARAQTLAQMGRMASMIAHDLRNPLSSIKVTLQVLSKQTATTDETAELKGIALEQVAYMEAILNDMLTYSRPQVPRLEWINPVKLLETAIGLARRKIEEQGVRLSTRYQPGLPTFPGDVTQLRQVFSNLLLNAVQAMEQTPPEQRELTVTAELQLTPEGTAIRFEICDHGCGIGEEVSEKLFEPFFTTRAKGTGLGLAIVRRILDEHGGQVRLIPREPAGTCAEVVLPTVPPEEVSGMVVAEQPGTSV